MAEKCRICGYRFKRGDGSLCPECFTARTEELSFGGDEFKASNIFGRSRSKEKLGSFLADEMREELHEDISMKKSLDRVDAEKTRSFTAEGANVKNESYKQAFQERRSRDRSTPGRVYTNKEAKTTAKPADNQAASRFLDSIDPNLKDRIYGAAPDENNFRYSSHNSGSTSNQQMLYGINGGRTPGANQTVTYNFPSKNTQKYSKGSNSKAAAVFITSIAIFGIFVGVVSSIDEENESKSDKKSYAGIDSVDISMPDLNIPDIDISIPDISIPDIKRDKPLSQKLDASYDIYTIYLSDYQKGDTVPDVMSDSEKRNFVYPIEDKVSSDETYREVTFMLYVDGVENVEDIPVLESMLLISKANGEEICVSLIYGLVTDTSNLLNGQYTMYVSFIVPDSAEEFDLDIDYNGKNEPEGYTYIDGFSYNILDAWNGRENDDSSENS